MCLHLYFADVHLLAAVAEGHRLAVEVGLIAHECHSQQIAPVWGCHGKTAVALAHGAVHQRRVLGLEQRYVGILDVLARACIHHTAFHSSLLSPRNHRQGQHHQYSKSFHCWGLGWRTKCGISKGISIEYSIRPPNWPSSFHQGVWYMSFFTLLPSARVFSIV